MMRWPWIRVNWRRMSIVAALAILFWVPPIPQPSAEGRTIGGVRRVSRRTSRRTTHRTSRRTTRRVARRHLAVLPAGHRTIVRAGTAYYVVGSVYYVQQMVGGEVVYVEVSK